MISASNGVYLGSGTYRFPPFNCTEYVETDRGSLCVLWIDGIVGLCFRDRVFLGPLFSIMPALVGGAAACSFLCKRIFPKRESSESMDAYITRVTQLFKLSFGQTYAKVEEDLISMPGETRAQWIARQSFATLQVMCRNAGKLTATVIALGVTCWVPHEVPTTFQMPVFTSLALMSMWTIRKGEASLSSLRRFCCMQKSRGENTTVEKLLDYRIECFVAALWPVFFSSVVVAIAVVAVSQIAHAEKKGIPPTFPIQAPGVVGLEYGVFALIHFLQTISARSQGNNISALDHAISSIAIPTFFGYMYISDGNIRIHHYLVGEFLRMFPPAALKLIGNVLALDGFVQLVIETGYLQAINPVSYWLMQLTPYGCDNVILDHIKPILISISIGILLEMGVKILWEKTPLPTSLELAVRHRIRTLIQKFSRSAPHSENGMSSGSSDELQPRDPEQPHTVQIAWAEESHQ